MKLLLSPLVLLVMLSPLSGQDQRIPLKEAQRFARLCVEQMGTIDSPIEIRPNASKPSATLGEGGGAMVIPDSKLTAQLLQQKKLIPLGQLWLRKWLPVVNGKAVPRTKLRMMTITIDDKERPMPLLLLALSTTGKNRELIIYSQGAKPLHKIPLKGTDFVQKLPLELEWQRGEKKSDKLVLTILGKMECILPITRE